jgi:hypothetical protein
MGRRKKTGKRRTITGAELTGTTGAGAESNAGAAARIDATESYQPITESTGAPLVETGHTLGESAVMESIAQLEAEANAALATAPEEPVMIDGAPVPPVATYDPNAPTEWDPYMQMAVEITAKVALPQWNLTADEKTEIQKSLAHILEQLYPGGLSGKFAPYLRLITVCGVITVTRAQANGGKLPGFGAKKIEPEPVEPAS